MTRLSYARWICVAVLLGHAESAPAQTLSHRGFVDGTASGFPQDTPDDSTQLLGDLLAREEVSLRPARWILLAAGVEFRANSDDQVDDSWQLDFYDRGRQRPRLSTRRAVATLTRGPFTLDLGKQFVRWGKTDIIVPTDRFAPRDFLTVIDAPYLAITAARATVQFGSHMVEAVWAPRFTPSRIPLLEQRWTVRPASVPAAVSIVETPTTFPAGSQAGIRWGKFAAGLNIPSPSMTGSTICRTFDPAHSTRMPGALSSRASTRRSGRMAPIQPSHFAGSP